MPFDMASASPVSEWDDNSIPLPDMPEDRRVKLAREMSHGISNQGPTLPELAINQVNDLNKKAGEFNILSDEGVKEFQQTGRLGGPKQAELGKQIAEGYNPAVMGVIKNKGGQWIKGSVEKEIGKLKSTISPTIREDMADVGHPWNERDERNLKQAEALNDWIDKKLVPYVKNDMATPEDPIRKLAEEGVSHSYVQDQAYGGEWVTDSTMARRVKAGFPAMGTSQHPAGLDWETTADEEVKRNLAKQFVRPDLTKPPGIYNKQSPWVMENKWLETVDPDTAVHSLDANAAYALKFDHVKDVLQEQLTTGELTPEMLKKVSLPDAIKRTHEYDQANVKRAKELAAKSAEGGPVTMEFPSGDKLVQLNKPGHFAAESDVMGHSVRGYEPPKGHEDWTHVSGNSGHDRYGHGGWEAIKSGKAEVHSLRGPDNKSHATIESVKGTSRGRYEDNLAPLFMRYPELAGRMEDSLGLEATSDQMTSWLKRNAPEVYKEFSLGPEMTSITQIKGPGNGVIDTNKRKQIVDYLNSKEFGDVNLDELKGVVDTRNHNSLQDLALDLGEEPRSPGFSTIMRTIKDAVEGQNMPRFAFRSDVLKALGAAAGAGAAGIAGATENKPMTFDTLTAKPVSEWDDNSTPIPDINTPISNTPKETDPKLSEESPAKIGDIPMENIVKAMVHHESSGNPNAVSNKGAQGLMQLMPKTAKSLGVTDPFDVEQNIAGGIKYITQLSNNYGGDLYKGLVAYNWGPGNVAKYGFDAAPKGTKTYANGIVDMARGLTVNPDKVFNKPKASEWDDTKSQVAGIPKAKFDVSSAQPVEDSSHDSSDYDPQKKGAKVIPSGKEKGSSTAPETWKERANRLAFDIISGKARDEGTKAVGDAAASAVTGMGSAIVGGLAGVGRGVGGLIGGESKPEALAAAVDTSKGVQEGGTWEPRSAGGKALERVQQIPMEKSAEGLGMIGEAIAGPAGEAIGKSLVPVLGIAAGGKGALTAARSAAMRPKVPIPGEDVSLLREMTPDQRERYDRAQKLGLKPTLGQVTRNPEQQTFERQIAGTKPGATLAQREEANNAALTKAVEDTDKQRAGRKDTENEAETGRSVARALEQKAKDSLDNINTLYEKAKAAGETDVLVDTKPLQKWLRQHKAESIAVPEIAAIQAKLAQLKTLGKAQGGLTINDYEILYRAANELTKPGDSSASFMRRVKEHINAATEGAGGDLYREARAARLKHAFEFEDREGIARLIDKKTRTDYQTPNEQIFNKTVLSGGSLEELKDVTSSLLSADPVKNPGAIQAVRNLQAQTIDWILEQSTGSIAMDSMGNAPFSPAGYKKAMKTIGRQKLEHLLGPDALGRLDAIYKTARENKTLSRRAPGSDTAQNLAVMLEREARTAAAKHLANSVPGARSAFEYFKTKREVKAVQTSVDEALNPSKASPEVHAAEAAKEKKLRRQYKMEDAGSITEGLAPAYPATLGSTEQDQ